MASLLSIRILMVAILACDCTGLRSFLPLHSSHYGRHVHKKRPALSLQENSSNSNKNDQAFFVSQREEALETLEQIDLLREKVVQQQTSDSSLYDEVQEMEKQVTRLVSQTLPPEGLSLEDYRMAIKYYIGLPIVVREALCDAVGFKDLGPSEAFFKAPQVVSLMYQDRARLTPQKLQDALQAAHTRRQPQPTIRETSEEEEIERLTDLFINDLNDGKSIEETKNENIVKQYLPRVTRKDGKEATASDLETLMQVLDNTNFVVKGKPEPIPGGYVVRGTNTKDTAAQLMEALDSRLPLKKNAEVCFLQDVTYSALESERDDGVVSDPVLVLLNSDMAPTTSRWILSFSTAAALTTAFLFAFECYGQNPNVERYISDLSAVGDYTGVSWFNYKLLDLLLPLVAIQGLHEAGHLLIASRDEIKTSPPTLLPFWILPYMGAQTQIKTSPKDFTSLFDFAFLGPFLGIVSSLAFLVLGLQNTVGADAEALKYFPMLPVEVIRTSTLGGTLIDTAFGSEGFITAQDPSTNIPLHPFCIAGFAGLVINCLDLLPLGSTDGGRLSQAVFGRGGHLLLGAFVWTALFFSFALLEQHDVLMYAWVVNNIVQNDMEVPCRNEVDQVPLPRALAAGALWIVAILTLLPMS